MIFLNTPTTHRTSTVHTIPLLTQTHHKCTLTKKNNIFIFINNPFTKKSKNRSGVSGAGKGGLEMVGLQSFMMI